MEKLVKGLNLNMEERIIYSDTKTKNAINAYTRNLLKLRVQKVTTKESFFFVGGGEFVQVGSRLSCFVCYKLTKIVEHETSQFFSKGRLELSHNEHVL